MLNHVFPKEHSSIPTVEVGDGKIGVLWCTLLPAACVKEKWEELNFSGECSVSEYSIVHISSFYAKTQLGMSENQPFAETLFRL